MNELQEMQDQITQLKAETMALKARGKAQAVRQRFVFALAVVGVGLAAMTHTGNTKGSNTPAQMEAGMLVCKELRVIDDNRRTVLSLNRTPDGEGQLNLYSANGAKRLVNLAATTDTGSGYVLVNDENGNKVVMIKGAGGKGSIWTQK